MNGDVIAAIWGAALVALNAESAASAAVEKVMPVTESMVRGDNKSFSYEVTTTASLAAIWALWTDVTTWKQWDKGLKDATADRPFALGVRGKITPLSGPSSSFEITEFESQRSYTFVTGLPLAKLTVRRVIIGTKPTRFRHEVSFSGALGGTWAKRFGPSFRAALPPTMRTLAKLAEGGESAGC